MSYSSQTRDQASEQSVSAQRKATAQFADNRSGLTAQLQQQAMMSGSSQVSAQLAQAEMMADSSVQQHKAIQLAAPEEELPMQGKFATAQLAGVEEEELLQGKFATAQLAGMEEEEPLQGKFDTLQRQGAGERATKPNNTGLPDQLKSGIENLSGYSMDDVKVHYNSSQPGQLNAHAYAQGSDIHVAPGQEQHLPHEAWHVVQQKQGRVKPTMQMKAGVPVNDDAGLENEADVMGARALSAGQTAAPAQRKLRSVGCAGVAQLAHLKYVEDSAKHHYSDGWGALYGIKNDEQLKAAVTKTAKGEWTKDLGEFYHEEEDATRPCTIGYKNRERIHPRTGNVDAITSIRHCGPSDQ